eukprot:TRINITY_DN12640_c0_g1_i7.p1 TRINITY_DN12640_c0_g1~~TRINITY_DN12640_c0_g1_i7.p1  ORF type:complete len:485 (-),score=172.35 TRINITY_DN12640_c0_g1_i7:307-1761(-)
MLGWLLEQVWSAISGLLKLLGFGAGPAIEDGTRVMVKTVTGQVVGLLLKPEWTIQDVKMHLSTQLGAKPEELRIIFAGKELRDDVAIDSCDLGNQSILHAVKVVRKVDTQASQVAELTSIRVEKPSQGGDEPLSQSLVDLQLTGDARQVAAEERTAKRAHFYSWCDSAQQLETAKLRVRCGACGEGAIVLHTDPCSWEDVLQADRIQGYCEACRQVAFAIFYFKCGGAESVSHSGHQSVPLYLVKSNLSDVPCLACTDLLDPVLVFPCTDRHVICTACFTDYGNSRLGERQFVLDPDLGYTLPCPVGCEDSLVKEPAHFRLMGGEQYERYQRFGAEELVLQSGGVLCPQPGCGAGILPDIDADCRRVACRECGYVFCRDCSMGAHLGDCLPCAGGQEPDRGAGAEYRSMDPADPRASRARWVGADPSSVTIRVNTKPCPGCRTPTERDGGCMHMICTKPGCGLGWCWVCQVEWERDCMANHWFG